MANSIPAAATGSNSTPLQRAFIREMLLSQPVEGYVANCRAIERATPPQYAKVKCPMLIIAGKEDKSAPLAGCERIFGELGTLEEGKRLVVLDGVGHWHCVEDGEGVGALVRGWCDELRV